MRTLTPHEDEVTDLYLELLDNPEVARKGDACRYALSVLPEPWIDVEFVHWLSEGSLTKIGRHILRVDHLDEDTHPLTREIVTAETERLPVCPACGSREVNQPDFAGVRDCRNCGHNFREGDQA